MSHRCGFRWPFECPFSDFELRPSFGFRVSAFGFQRYRLSLRFSLPNLSAPLPHPRSAHLSALSLPGHSLTLCHQCSRRFIYCRGFDIRSASAWLPSDLSGHRWSFLMTW